MRPVLADSLDQVQTRQSRHLQIRQNKVRLEFLDLLQSGLTTFGVQDRAVERAFQCERCEAASSLGAGQSGASAMTLR